MFRKFHCVEFRPGLRVFMICVIIDQKFFLFFCCLNSTDASHGERSDGEHSAIGADFLSSVSEHKKSIRAVESFESPCGAAVRSRSVGDEDESRPIRLSPSRVDFRQEGENLSRAVRHSGCLSMWGS